MNQFQSFLDSINRRGRLRTFLDYVLFNLPTILVVIITTFISFQVNNSNFAKVEKQVNTIANSIRVEVKNSDYPTELPQDGIKGVQTDMSSEFDPDSWIIDEHFSQNEDGFYCATTKSFDYWWMWSKEKLPAAYTVKIRLKTKFSDTSTPTVNLTYGEYLKDKSPHRLYEMHFFDSDTRSVRLYNDKNESVDQDWLKEDPDFESEMVIALSTRVPNPSDRRLAVVPTVTYVPTNSESQIEFKTSKDFLTTLPTVDLDSVQQQFGIGVRSGNCIKPITVEY